MMMPHEKFNSCEWHPRSGKINQYGPFFSAKIHKWNYILKYKRNIRKGGKVASIAMVKNEEAAPYITHLHLTVREKWSSEVQPRVSPEANAADHIKGFLCK